MPPIPCKTAGGGWRKGKPPQILQGPPKTEGTYELGADFGCREAWQRSERL